MDRGGARRLGGCITGVICTYISDLSRSRLRVNRVGFVMSTVCPAYPKQQTITDRVGTSKKGHKRTFWPVHFYLPFGLEYPPRW